MALQVHFHNPPPEKDLAFLKSLLDESVSLTLGPEIPESAQFQILITGRPTKESLDASSVLERLIIPFAGVPEATREMLIEYPQIQVHNLHYNAASTAEMAVALLLAAAKHILPFDRTFRDHDWSPRYEPNPSLLLEGKMLLILGYGEIGQRVGSICSGLGMKILALKHSVSGVGRDGEVEIHPPGDLKTLLGRADVLVICLPATPETRGLIGEEELELLPPNALLVNVARGAIVDEKALYQALVTKRLAGAGIDVWYQYPESEAERDHTPPSKYPFHKLDNVVMSPHRAGGWVESEEHRMRHLAQLLNRAARDESMGNLVEISSGY
jgi:phosphoglycerate dehydrogenase-like enzyme